jgi:hypothetical protein
MDLIENCRLSTTGENSESGESGIIFGEIFDQTRLLLQTSIYYSLLFFCFVAVSFPGFHQRIKSTN